MSWLSSPFDNNGKIFEWSNLEKKLKPSLRNFYSLLQQWNKLRMLICNTWALSGCSWIRLFSTLAWRLKKITFQIWELLDFPRDILSRVSKIKIYLNLLVAKFLAKLFGNSEVFDPSRLFSQSWRKSVCPKIWRKFSKELKIISSSHSRDDLKMIKR